MYQPTHKVAANTESPFRIEGQVGNTPLLQLSHIPTRHGVNPHVAIFAKAEWFNPSGSVKDRAALNIIRSAERDGLLQPGMTLLDSTSGNAGIAYAMLGSARGYRVVLTLPENASPERIGILRAYGAELILTDPLEGSDGAIVEARRLAEEAPDIYFYANQYDNPANWQAHYFTTANEIWEQTNGEITHFVAGLGTSGTFVGTSRRLKELNADIRCLSMQPNSPFHGLEGLKHIPTAIRPAIYDEQVADLNVTVRTEKAHQMARELASQEGIFAGISGAANVVAALDIAQQLDEGVVVTVIPDNGFKYLSDNFWGQRA